jgi:hypothetical protein
MESRKRKSPLDMSDDEDDAFARLAGKASRARIQLGEAKPPDMCMFARRVSLTGMSGAYVTDCYR